MIKYYVGPRDQECYLGESIVDAIDIYEYIWDKQGHIIFEEVTPRKTGDYWCKRWGYPTKKGCNYICLEYAPQNRQWGRCKYMSNCVAVTGRTWEVRMDGTYRKLTNRRKS